MGEAVGKVGLTQQLVPSIFELIHVHVPKWDGHQSHQAFVSNFGLFHGFRPLNWSVKCVSNK